MIVDKTNSDQGKGFDKSSARSSCAGSEHTGEVQLEGTGEGLIDASILENGNCCAVGS